MRAERMGMTAEAFVAERKEILKRSDDRIHEGVRGSMIRRGLPRWEDQAVDAALGVFDETAKFEAGDWNPIIDDLRDEFERQIREALLKTKNTDDMARQTTTITKWLSTAAVNAGTEAAVASNPVGGGGLEWRTMGDSSVRDSHREAEGQIIPMGGTFNVGGVELHYPGEPIGPPEVWLNCRCIAQPTESSFTALTAAATGGEPSTSAVVVALPAAGDWTTEVSSEESGAHVTLLFLGDADFDPEAVLAVIAAVADAVEGPVSEFVSGSATLGADKAEVVLIDAKMLADIRGAILSRDDVRDVHDRVEQFPAWIPHLTLGYPEAPPKSDARQDSITFDRLALWYGPEQTEYPLGGNNVAEDHPDIANGEDEEEPEGMVADASPQAVAEEEADDAPMIPDDEAMIEIPWHGVLAPEGVWSGDKRRFADGSLTNRDLPLPLKFMWEDDEAHKGSYPVARIERIARFNGLIRAEGHFDTTPAAYEAVRLRANNIMRGVSVDVDQAELALDDQEDGVTFSKGRIASATICAIPAFAEAYFDLGTWEDVGETLEGEVLGEVAPAELSKLGQSVEAFVSEESWDGSASRFTPEQWHNSCILHTHTGAPKSKSECKLPIKEPGGAINRAAVHAAAARFNQVQAPAEAKAKAKAALRSAYKQIGEEPADKVAASLVWEAFADAEAPGVTKDGTPPKCKYCENPATQYVLHSEGMAFVPACDDHIEQAKEDAAASVPGGEPDPGNIDRVAKYGMTFKPIPRITKDGPGWITDPKPTTRITEYWVDGRGAAKIGWGAPGDFNRCRTNLAKYVQNPDWLAGLCANLHYRALRAWPGQAAGRTEEMTTKEMTPVGLVAAGVKKLPADAFRFPDLKQVTPFTVTDDGRVFGHIATRDVCHIGFADECKTAPYSMTDYAWFHTGEVETDAGPVGVGQITMGTGHAGDLDSVTAAVGHYDNTGYAVADVCAYDDDFGIAVAGMLRPDLTEDDVRALKAAAISGDWRRIIVGGKGANLEMVAALAVNVPGFPIPRASLAASAGHVTSVTALSIPHTGAGILDDDFRAKMEAYNAEQALIASAHLAKSKVLSKAAQRAKAKFTAGRK